MQKNNSNELVGKWKPFLVSEKFTPIEDAKVVRTTAAMLENYRRDVSMKNSVGSDGFGSLFENQPTTMANTTGNLAKNDVIMLALIRRTVPNLMAHDFCSVVPMPGPTSFLMTIQPRYASGALGPDGKFPIALFQKPDTTFTGRTDVGGWIVVTGDTTVKEYNALAARDARKIDPATKRASFTGAKLLRTTNGTGEVSAIEDKLSSAAAKLLFLDGATAAVGNDISDLEGTYYHASATGGTVNQTLTARQFSENEKPKHDASIANLFQAGVDAAGKTHNEVTGMDRSGTRGAYTYGKSSGTDVGLNLPEHTLDNEEKYKIGRAFDPTQAELMGSMMVDPATGVLTMRPGAREIPQMQITVHRAPIQAHSRKIKAQMTMEVLQDARTTLGLSYEHEIINTLTTEILAEVNRELLETVYITARDGSTRRRGANGIFDMAVDGFVGQARNAADAYKGLIVLIDLELGEIARATRAGKGNFIITSSGIVTALQSAAVLDWNPSLDTQRMHSDDTASTYAGSMMNGRIKVYIDPYHQPEYNQDFFVAGYKGPRQHEAGIYYCPYVPLTMQKVTSEHDAHPSIFFQTRYGMARNPFAHDYDYTNIDLAASNQELRYHYSAIQQDLGAGRITGLEDYKKKSLDAVAGQGVLANHYGVGGLGPLSQGADPAALNKAAIVNMGSNNYFRKVLVTNILP